MKRMNRIKEQFNDIANRYDEQRKMLIPCFNDFYSVASAIADANTRNPSILDLGAGTGLYSSFLLAKYPSATFTLIDVSDEMITMARSRFKTNPNFQYVIADFTEYDFKNTYDLIISSLSIHHLPDDKKIHTYETVYSLLNQNGIFVNADQVIGNSERVDKIYKAHWRESIENSGLSDADVTAAYSRISLDNMAPLQSQLKWLMKIGFADVDCVYKYYNFAVIHGKKQ